MDTCTASNSSEVLMDFGGLALEDVSKVLRALYHRQRDLMLTIGTPVTSATALWVLPALICTIPI